MNTQDQNQEANDEGSTPELVIDAKLELKLLKERATMMGIAFSNNISAEKLKEKINAKMEGEDEQEDKKPDVVVNALEATTKEEVAKVVAKKGKTPSLRDYLHAQEMKMVRLRITNLDPKKKNLPGEILTIANPYIGTVRKFVPFGEVTDEGYHVPYCLYRMMDERRFLDIQTKKVKGQTVVTQRWAKEFALEVLPPLTEKELKQLAIAQIAAGTAETPEA